MTIAAIQAAAAALLVPTLAGSAAFALLLTIYAVAGVRDPMSRRVRALNERREQLKAGTAGKPRKRQRAIHRSDATDKLTQALSSLKMLQDSQVEAIELRLAQAGIRKKQWAVAVVLARLLLPVSLGIVAAVMIYGIDYFPDWGGPKRFLAFAAAIGIGYKGPDLYLRNRIARRTDAIRKGLPDALDLLVICAEAGLTIDAAIERVARELTDAYPVLGDELSMTSIELSFLTERRKAFENLARRVDLDSVRAVVTTLIQTERYGTPLAAALRVLSGEFRNDRMMRAEEKAARLPAIMTVPLILFILPVLFIVILGPASCSIADAFSGVAASSQ